MGEGNLDGLKPLFSGKEVEAVRGLWEDPENRQAIMQSLGQRLLASNEILGSPYEQVNILVSQARFADSEEECVYVAGVLLRNLGRVDIFPRLMSLLPPEQDLEKVAEEKTYHIKETAYENMKLRHQRFAEAGLISLGLFPKAIDANHKRYGGVSRVYLTERVKFSFEISDRKDVGEHLEPWTALIGEVFCC